MELLEGLWLLLGQSEGYGDSKTTMGLWKDEYGNNISAFFTTAQAAEKFKSAESQWLEDRNLALEPMPVSSGLPAIVDAIRADASFFVINPESRERFNALSAAEFLGELLGMAFEDGASGD